MKECPDRPACQLCCLFFCTISGFVSPPPHACAAVCHQTHESITRNAHNFTLTSDLCELFICVPPANNSIPWQSCAEDVWSTKSRVSGEVVVNKHQSSCTLACRPCLWRSNRTTVAPTSVKIDNFSKIIHVLDSILSPLSSQPPIRWPVRFSGVASGAWLPVYFHIMRNLEHVQVVSLPIMTL